jgi:hypothetical protein
MPQSEPSHSDAARILAPLSPDPLSPFPVPREHKRGRGKRGKKGLDSRKREKMGLEKVALQQQTHLSKTEREREREWHANRQTPFGNSGARLFFQISLENRHISLDFSLDILEPQNFPSIKPGRTPSFFEVTLKYADLGSSRGTSDHSMKYKFQNIFYF